MRDERRGEVDEFNLIRSVVRMFYGYYGLFELGNWESWGEVGEVRKV